MASEQAHGGKVDLSTASAEDLQRIEGIDGARSRLILEYREQHGAFGTWDDFEAVVGIGPTLVEKAQESAVLGGESAPSRGTREAPRAAARRAGDRQRATGGEEAGRSSGRGERREAEQAGGEAGREAAPAERGDAQQSGDAEGEESAEELEPSELLSALGHLDLEAAAAYSIAADAAADPELRDHLSRFGDDHLRHVQAINAMLRADGEPEIEARDPDEMLLAPLAFMAGPLGDEALLVTILANEQVTNMSYEEALAYEWEPETERQLEEFRKDEERHLSWLSARQEQLAGTQRPEAPA